MNQLHESTAQEQMIRSQVIERGISNERVLSALRAVPRDRFFLEDLRNEAFADRAAPIGHGQTISQPYIVALMTDRLDLHGTERVLEIGTGSGYQTAILSRLAAEVFTVERIKPLLDIAFETLLDLNCRNVKFKLGDGTLGWSDAAPFDRILVAAAAPALPRALLLGQLADGGIAVLPVGAADEQMLVSIRRRGNALESTDVSPCRFVPLIGAEGWPKSREQSS